MRANLFAYREVDDPWLREMRQKPVETMNAALPRLRRITGEYSACAGDVKIRPADLYVSTGYRQPGVVLVGDAFATTCPVTGTGTDKVFTDVAQLCNVHIPAWLATEGMGEDKIASFYDDPVKQACDAWSMAKAFSFRKVTIETAALLARAALGALPGVVRRRRLAADAQGISAESKPKPPFLLVVILVIVVVFIVVVGLTGRVVRRVALVVPELAVDAVGREQLRVRAALDRLAA
jgi:2-polyprenyl-6-methoxyphenol hydroxylase-like FAD-dependent oxidoreductase